MLIKYFDSFIFITRMRRDQIFQTILTRLEVPHVQTLKVAPSRAESFRM